MAGAAAYLFDMDGLLLDTERLFLRSFLELTDDIGLARDVSEEFFLSLVGTSSKVTSQRLPVFLPDTVSATDFEAEWRRRHDANVAAGVPLRPFVMKVLQTLKQHGARMAVVTSTNARPARDHLDHAGILPFFELIKAGDQVSANKPDPAPYQEAARDLGVDPRDCVAFEDSDFGTQAAATAGCSTYQIPDLRPVDKPLPSLGQKIVPNLQAALIDLGLAAQSPV